MVGGCSDRKGCDQIVDALKDSGLRFLHVGAIVDMKFPMLPTFTHVDAVDQSKLTGYYHKAQIALLPSREEGLAMVQAQAIACNLPLVGSADSGAEDLQQMVDYPEYITIIEDFTSSSVLEAIHVSLNKQKEMRDLVYAGNAVKNLTWEAYGTRYSEFLTQIITTR